MAETATTTHEVLRRHAIALEEEAANLEEWLGEREQRLTTRRKVGTEKP